MDYPKLPNDPDTNQVLAVFDKMSRNVDTAKDEVAMAVTSLVERAQNIILERNDEIRRLRAQVEQLTADAIIRADRQAILIQAMWHIREMSLYDHDREIATKVLTDIGELR